MSINPFELYLQTRLYSLYTRLWVERFRKLTEGDVVVDAGAFWGGFATYAARKVGKKGRVICFEPDPVNFQVLSANVRRFGNVVLVNKALGDSVGRVEFESSKHYSSSVIKKGVGKMFLVNQTTLDKAVKELGEDRINVLKVNVEGSEVGVIRGARRMLRDTEYAAISSHEVNGKQTAYRIEQILKELGFETKLVQRVFKFTGHIDLYGIRR